VSLEDTHATHCTTPPPPPTHTLLPQYLFSQLQSFTLPSLENLQRRLPRASTTRRQPVQDPPLLLTVTVSGSSPRSPPPRGSVRRRSASGKISAEWTREGVHGARDAAGGAVGGVGGVGGWRDGAGERHRDGERGRDRDRTRDRAGFQGGRCVHKSTEMRTSGCFPPPPSPHHPGRVTLRSFEYAARCPD
jgi:hypothetical protein